MVNKGKFIEPGLWYKPGAWFLMLIFVVFFFEFKRGGYKRKKGRVNTHPFH